MKNIITVTVDNPEDFRKILGTLANIGASFSVERIEETKQPVRAYQRKTEDGKSVKEIILDLIANGGSTTRSTIQKTLVEVGFSSNSVSPGLTELRRAGLIRTSGDIVYPAQGKVDIALNSATQ